MSISRETEPVKLLLKLFKRERIAFPVVDLVKKFKKEMNKTTVYRILNRLENSGLIHSFIDNKGQKRYAKGINGDPDLKDQSTHPHFLCEDCGISTCLPMKISTPLIPEYKVRSSEQIFLGQCKDCE